MLVFLFSGQGSQYYQMGAELFAKDRAYRTAFEECAALAGPIRGRLLVEIVFGRPAHEPWDDLVESGQALFAQGYALARALMARGVQPDAFAGYSLGEQIAIALSGAAKPGEMMGLARRQAEHALATTQESALLSILAPPDLLDRHPALAALGELACVNSRANFVMACRLESVGPLGRALDRLDVTWVKVPVRRAFHSSLIEPAAPGYTALAEGIPFGPPSLPLYSDRKSVV